MTGNTYRGEVGFEAADKAWTLRYSINALCILEDEMGKGINEIVGGLDDEKGVRLSVVRTLFRVGLADRQEAITDAEAGEIIQEIGLTEALTLVARALTASFPQQAKNGGAGPLNRKQRRAVAAGAGRRS